MGDSSTVKWMTKPRIVCVIAVLCSCVLAIPARAQQQPEPEGPSLILLVESFRRRQLAKVRLYRPRAVDTTLVVEIERSDVGF